MSDTVHNRAVYWTEHRLLAADLVADGRLTDAAIAERCQVSRTTIGDWKRDRRFRTKVDELIVALEHAVLSRGIARRANRVRAKNDRWYRLKHIIAERAAAADMQDVPGGKTGLLVRTTKIIGTGEHATLVNEYALDTGLLAELRQLEKDAAIEAGQWTEKRDVTKQPVAVNSVLDLALLSDQQLDDLERLIAAARHRNDEAAPAGALE